MAFLPSGLTLWSNPPSPPQFGLPQWWGYATSDDMATVAATGYFNLGGAIFPSNQTFLVGDQLYCYCSDGVASLQIATLTPNITTTASAADIPAGSITHAMLGSQIVQAGNIANATITTTQISASAGILGSQLSATAGIVGTQLTAGTLTTTEISNSAAITGTQLASATVSGSNMVNHTVTSTQLALNTIQFATVTGITPNTLYSAGTSLVAAPGAGLVIVPLSFAFNYIYATAQYTSGGAIGVQYNSTVHQGGQLCSATLAAATFNAYAANEMVSLAVAVSGVSSGSINQPLYLTCASNNFASGSGTITAFVSYIVVSAT